MALLVRFLFQQSSSCHDHCCSTSQPCLHGGRCEATCMQNNRRFRCSCGEEIAGDRCENIPRSCAFYFNSADRTKGLRTVYAPDNTTYHVYCYFNVNSMATLAMSYSVENQPKFGGQPFSNDYPVNEDSMNWQNYRLGRNGKM